MRIKILAGETLGTRSLCTTIETNDARILIDPGIALGKRFGLYPHYLEYEKLYEGRKLIEKEAEKCDLVLVSHYHYDHFTPFFDNIDNEWTFADSLSAERIYKNKLVFTKDPENNINNSQRNRGKQFVKSLQKYNIRFRICDNSSFKVGKTEIKFSEPVFHGEEFTPLGYVVMFIIKDEDEKLVFASDTEGPMNEKALKIIEKEKPDYLIISGPPLYLVNYEVSTTNFQKGIDNLKHLTKYIKNIIVDHHLLRSKDSLVLIEEIRKHALNHDCNVFIISEFMGKEKEMLESIRKDLYEMYPPKKEFEEWIKKREGLPPIFREEI